MWILRGSQAFSPVVNRENKYFHLADPSKKQLTVKRTEADVYVKQDVAFLLSGTANKLFYARRKNLGTTVGQTVK
jgi:hypothetical protein